MDASINDSGEADNEQTMKYIKQDYSMSNVGRRLSSRREN